MVDGKRSIFYCKFDFLLQIRLDCSVAFYKSFQNITIHGLINNILKGFVNQDASISFSRYHRDAAISKTLFDHGATVGRKRLARSLITFFTFLVFKQIKLFS